MNNKIEVVQPDFALGEDKDAQIKRAANKLMMRAQGGTPLYSY